MRHDSTINTASDRTSTASGVALVCLVLTAGALFGMAGLTALAHLGLDLTTVRDDLIIGRVAHSRSALAWWAWWLLPVASFLLGPVSVAVMRFMSVYWWLLRGPRLLAAAAAVLALASIGHLPTSRPALDLGAGAALGALVALLSAALAMVGARCTRAVAHSPASLSGQDDPRRRSFDPVPDSQARRGGGSIDSGIPGRRFGSTPALAPGFLRLGRLAFAGVLALAVLAAVSAVSGAAVMLELIAPGSMLELLASASPTPQAAAAAPLPADSGPRPHAAIPMSASEFTFTKGYAKRHAAQLAAELVTAALRADIQVPPKLDDRNIAVMHGERFDNTLGRSARTENLPASPTRSATTTHHAAGQHRYVANHRHGGHDRRYAYNRHRGQVRYSRNDDGYRFAGF